MSTQSKTPFSRSEANPQSIQKLLDENAQLIRVLVENMNSKGKSTECIQYQQTLHRNLVFLASLADPSLNLQSVLPAPGSTQFGQQPQQSQQQQSSTSTSAPSTSAPPSSLSTPPPPHSSSMMSSSISSQNQQPAGQSPQMPSQQSHHAPQGQQQQQVSQPHHQQTRQQPQATMHGANMAASTATEVHWTSSSHSGAQRPPSSMDPGQYGGMKQAYGGGVSSWGPQGQPGMYGMQRAPPSSMMGGVSASGYPMGSPGMVMDEHRRQQLLRLRQERLIHAQQAHRLQQQQQVQGGMHAGGMYPGAGGMMPPPPPHPHAHPHQGGMPPGYPQSRMTPPNMPPGPMPM